MAWCRPQACTQMPEGPVPECYDQLQTDFNENSGLPFNSGFMSGLMWDLLLFIKRPRITLSWKQGKQGKQGLPPDSMTLANQLAHTLAESPTGKATKCPMFTSIR